MDPSFLTRAQAAILLWKCQTGSMCALLTVPFFPSPPSADPLAPPLQCRATRVRTGARMRALALLIGHLISSMPPPLPGLSARTGAHRLQRSLLSRVARLHRSLPGECHTLPQSLPGRTASAFHRPLLHHLALTAGPPPPPCRSALATTPAAWTRVRAIPAGLSWRPWTDLATAGPPGCRWL